MFSEPATDPLSFRRKRTAARNLLSIHPPDASHFGNADQ